MKNLILASAVIAAMAGALAMAEPASHLSEEEKAQRLARMKAHLQLSDEQVAQMKQIRAEGGNRDDIRAILTQEQQQKWDEARKRHRQKGNKNAPSAEES